MFPAAGTVDSLRRQLQESNIRNRDLRAKIDAAQTTDENKRHWGNADSLGPNAALDAGTRAKLRNRSRYESLNNSYCRGLVRTLSNDLIGTGPRLQLQIGEGAAYVKQAKAIEKLYSRWAQTIGLGRKYRLLAKCDVRDGEGIAILDTNLRVKHPIKLDLRCVEAEQCTTPWGAWNDPYTVDGIKFDRFWQPLEYYFLKFHPGETNGLAQPMEWETIRAEFVLHWFEQDRPGQMRGIPRITSSLPLFSQLRRFTLATLTAAEFAAVIAGVLKTNLPAGEHDESMPDAWDLFEVVRGALLTLPDGHEATQMKAEHPQTTYPDFKREILNEAGRGPGAPLNVVSGNSSQYNFSSGRLDHLPYQRGQWIEREDFRLVVMDPVFIAFAEEAAFANLLPTGIPLMDEWAWSWNFDAFDSIDPVKDAQADDIRLADGMLSFKEGLAARGVDYDEHLGRLAQEVADFARRGLRHPMMAEASAPQQQQAQSPAEYESQAESAERLRAALAEVGIAERQAEAIMELMFAPLPTRRRLHGLRNGFHPVGGRA